MAAPAASPAAGATPAASTDPSGGTKKPVVFPTQRLCGAIPTAGEASCMSVMRTDVNGPLGLLAPGQTPTGYGPTDLQDAYDLPSATAGAGATVAIVDAFDDPNAESDLAIYRTQFGLPACTTANGCFRKVDERGGTAYPVPDTGWAGEISVDVDMVSAACPQCHILLVEADDNTFASLFDAVNEAVDLGAKYVSNSYGGPENPNETTDDEQSFNHPGVAITASSGDVGYGVSYPAGSRYVTSVGGTTLNRASNTRGWTETAWSGAGSGCSSYDPKPSFQTDSLCQNRTVADVSAVADTNTGVAVYASYGNPGWTVFGGTSVAAPIIASVYALAGPASTGDYPNTYPYDADPSMLNDVTAGSNGGCGTYLCTAATGYDGPTGLGTPKGIRAFGPPGPHGTVSGTVTDAADGHPLADALVTAGTAKVVTDEHGQYSMSLAVGSYSATVTKYGYNQGTATVAVTDSGNTVQDFALAPQPTATISGTVADNSGHGWPLYTKIEASGTPLDPVYTDPFTGEYHLTVPANASYTLHLTPQSPGYSAIDIPIQVASTDITHDVAMTVDPTTCTAPGYAYAYQGMPVQPFDGTTVPAGWTVKDNTGAGGWQFTDPLNRGNLTGGSGHFAMLDSDFLGPNHSEDTELISPAVDLTGISAPTVGFNTDYLSFAVTVANVDVSIDGGTTWTTVWHHTTDDVRGPTLQNVPIPQAAGQSNVRVRFHYQDTWGFWWEVDNVFIGLRACTPINGGIVAGQVTDANTGGTVAGATVTSGDQPSVTATSIDTREDPNLGDGFYSMFSSLTGQHPFTASKHAYQNATAPVTVVANAVTRADLALTAGHVVATTGGVTATQAMGTVTTHDVTLSNDGTAPVSVTVGERGGSAAVAPQGAPLQQVNGTFSPLSAASATAGGSPAVNTSSHTEPWAPTADFPTVVMDNAMAVANDGKVYSFGGVKGLNGPASSAVYDPSTQIWSPITEPSTKRDKASVAYLGGKFYVVGGWDATTGAVVSSTEIYDPATNTWSTGAANPRAHAATAITVLNGKIYVVGGCSATSCGTTDTMVYDPASNAWSLAARYPQSIAWQACGTIAGKIYCAGGTADFGDTKNGYAYDPATNAWTQIPSMPIDLWGMSSAAANGTLVVSGGVTNGNATVTNQGYAFDPTHGTWTAIPNADDTVYRAGSACGFFTVGGAVGDFNAIAQGKLLPGLDQCNGTSDVTWLSENTTGFTIQPGQSVTFTATLDATGPTLNEPGPYTAQFAVQTDSPYEVSPVGVTMITTAPASWSTVVGKVVGIDCSGTLVAVPGTTVKITLTSATFTVRTDKDAVFGVWLASGSGPVTFNSSKPGWEVETLSSTLTPGEILITVILTQQSGCP